jgi:hypothetical protein
MEEVKAKEREKEGSLITNMVKINNVPLLDNLITVTDINSWHLKQVAVVEILIWI